MTAFATKRKMNVGWGWWTFV